MKIALSIAPTAFLVAATAVPATVAFTATSSAKPRTSNTLQSVSTFPDDEYDEPQQPRRRRQEMSTAVPFLKCPDVLKDSDLAGNYGFDPLGFAKNKERLWTYREAEIKHARLAMLAAIGWPLSELLDRPIAEFFGAPAVLDAGDRVPSVLNGGMEQISPVWWGFCLGLCGAIDNYGQAIARRGKPDYFPGNLGFDPLGLFPKTKEGREHMKVAEIKHGRLAMLAVLGYVIEEAETKMAVVEETPILLEPISESAEQVLENYAAAEQMLEGYAAAI